MKRAGIIGGMSWESTLEYYRIMNQEVKRKLGKLHSADMLIYSFDFEDIEIMQHEDDWEGLSKAMVDAAKDLVAAKADFIVIATNTMHKLAPDIVKEVNVPLLHIADATADEIKKNNFKKVALLGTRFTMEGKFYREKLEKEHNIEVVVPYLEDRKYIHNVIYSELCLGEIKEESRKNFEIIIDKLKNEGAQGVILGCTEIPLLIKQDTSPLPIFDTSTIHAKAAVKFALEGDK
jgi:aspartate racemase